MGYCKPVKGSCAYYDPKTGRIVHDYSKTAWAESLDVKARSADAVAPTGKPS